MKNWIEQTFNKKKALIGLCHIKALPGDPMYDEKAGMDYVFKSALDDVLALQKGGIDGIQFTNEFSIPYESSPVSPCIIASMGTIIGELKPYIKVPFGANIIGDTKASVALCAATGAKYTRGSYHGTWATNEGLLNSECADIYRLRHNLRYDDLKLVHYVVPESSLDVAGRDPVSMLKSHYFLNKPDALGICGLVAGQKVDVNLLNAFRKEYKDAILFAVTGITVDNVKEIMSVADAAFVGTYLKKDHKFENPVDENNVSLLMNEFNKIR